MSSSFFARGVELRVARRRSSASRSRRRPACIRRGEHAPCARAQLLALARDARLLVASMRDSRARSRRSRRDSARAPAARSTCCARRLRAWSTGGSVPGASFSPFSVKLRGERLVQRGHAVVVEARRDRAEHRHRRRAAARTPRGCAGICLRTSRSASCGALAVELVDRDEVGEVEHVDLLELARGAELRRHHVQRHVDERHDRRVALADARGLDDDEVEARRPCTRRSRRAAPATISLPASRVASERM